MPTPDSTCVSDLDCVAPQVCIEAVCAEPADPGDGDPGDGDPGDGDPGGDGLCNPGVPCGGLEYCQDNCYSADCCDLYCACDDDGTLHCYLYCTEGGG
jgi:hypothetical protein